MKRCHVRSAAAGGLRWGRGLARDAAAGVSAGAGRVRAPAGGFCAPGSPALAGTCSGSGSAAAGKRRTQRAAWERCCAASSDMRRSQTQYVYKPEPARLRCRPRQWTSANCARGRGNPRKTAQIGPDGVDLARLVPARRWAPFVVVALTRRSESRAGASRVTGGLGFDRKSTGQRVRARTCRAHRG